MPKLLSLNTFNYRRGGSDAVFFDHDDLFREADGETGRLGDWETGRLGDWETGRLGDCSFHHAAPQYKQVSDN